MRHRVATISLMVAALSLAVAHTPAHATKQKLKTARFSLSILLVSPSNGTVVPRYGASPLFKWRIVTTGRKLARGSGRLEVSTDPTFAQSATFMFDCGYSGICPTQYRFGSRFPFWYDRANSCSDVPPVGNCKVLSTTLYWRVRYEPVGARSYTSPVGVLRRSAPTDTTPPTVDVRPGSSPHGSPATVYFYAGDQGELVREIVQLYDSRGKVVFGVRTEWNSVAASGQSYRDIALPIPSSIEAGAYRYCVTVQDRNDNRATDCAAYRIT